MHRRLTTYRHPIQIPPKFYSVLTRIAQDSASKIDWSKRPYRLMSLADEVSIPGSTARNNRGRAVENLRTHGLITTGLDGFPHFTRMSLIFVNAILQTPDTASFVDLSYLLAELTRSELEEFLTMPRVARTQWAILFADMHILTSRKRHATNQMDYEIDAETVLEFIKGTDLTDIPLSIWNAPSNSRHRQPDLNRLDMFREAHVESIRRFSNHTYEKSGWDPRWDAEERLRDALHNEPDFSIRYEDDWDILK